MVLKGDGVYIVKDARALKLSVRFSKPRKKPPYILDVLSVTSSDTVQWFSNRKRKLDIEREGLREYSNS